MLRCAYSMSLHCEEQVEHGRLANGIMRLKAAHYLYWCTVVLIAQMQLVL